MNLLEVTHSMRVYACVCVCFGVHVELYCASREHVWKNRPEEKGAKHVERPKGWTAMNMYLYAISDPPFPPFKGSLFPFR